MVSEPHSVVFKYIRTKEKNRESRLMLTSDKAGAVWRYFVHSNVPGGPGMSLRFLLRNGASRCQQKHGGHVKRSVPSDGRDVQPAQGGLSMSLHGLSMWYNQHQNLAASATWISVLGMSSKIHTLLLQHCFWADRAPRTWGDICNHSLVGFVPGAKFLTCMKRNCCFFCVYRWDWYLLGRRASYLSFISVYCVLQVSNGQLSSNHVGNI